MSFSEVHRDRRRREFGIPVPCWTASIPSAIAFDADDCVMPYTATKARPTRTFLKTSTVRVERQMKNIHTYFHVSKSHFEDYSRGLC